MKTPRSPPTSRPSSWPRTATTTRSSSCSWIAAPLCPCRTTSGECNQPINHSTLLLISPLKVRLRRVRLFELAGFSASFAIPDQRLPRSRFTVAHCTVQQRPYPHCFRVEQRTGTLGGRRGRIQKRLHGTQRLVETDSPELMHVLISAIERAVSNFCHVASRSRAHFARVGDAAQLLAGFGRSLATRRQADPRATRTGHQIHSKRCKAIIDNR